MVADKVNQVNISKKEKISVINELKSLMSVGTLQNKFIVGLEDYIEYQIDSIANPNKQIERVTNEIYILNNNKYILRKHILKWIDEERIELNYSDCDELCKNYFGKMNNNYKNKDWNKVIKEFRVFYR